MPTGVEFIEGLHGEWSAGTITREAALQRLLPWEDDLTARTQEELEAAWVLRQELEAAPLDDTSRTTDDGRRTTNGVPSEGTSIEGMGSEPNAANRLKRRLADLRANPLISRDDLLAAHSLCTRLNGAGVAGEASVSAPDADYISTRCGEVEARVARHVESVHVAIERASHLIESSPDIADKLQAVSSIREALVDIEALRSDDPTLHDMVAWCEQTRHELKTLLARRDLLMSDVAGLSTSEALDVGLVESCKQRLILMSDMQLSKDDLELRKAARALATRLTDYMEGKLQPGPGPGPGATVSKEEVAEYRRLLHLAMQAPEAISADQAKSYGDLLAEAEASLPPAEHGSEPPSRSLPATPPPQPKDTTGSQPNAAAVTANATSPGTTPAATTSSTAATSTPTFRPLQAPPPPPKVQPGWGATSTQPVAASGTVAPQKPGKSSVPPSPPHNTTANPSAYSQPTHSYSPGAYRQGISPAVWVGIGIGAFVFLMLIILTIALVTNRGGSGGSGGSGGGSGNTGAGEVARTFYVNLQRHDYQAAFDHLTPDLGAALDVNTLRGRIVIMENGQGAIQSINVSNVTETGDTAQATITVGYGRGSQSTEQFSLRKVGGRWLIANIT